MAAEWAAALDESKPAGNEVASEGDAAESVAPAAFANFAPAGQRRRRAGNDINMILDIPVQLTVELGRTRIPIKHILQLAQGSVVELDALAGEPMDVLVNGYLIAQGEVVVVNDKFGIRLTDIVTPSRAHAPPEPRAECRTSHELPDLAAAVLFVRASSALIPAGAVAAQAHAAWAAAAAHGALRARRPCCRWSPQPAHGDGRGRARRRTPLAGAGRHAAADHHAAHAWRRRPMRRRRRRGAAHASFAQLLARPGASSDRCSCR